MFYILTLLFSISNKWDYDKGGSNWNNLCKKGLHQSPINIVNNIVKQQGLDHHLQFHFENNQIEYFNNGIYLEYEPIQENSLGYFTYHTSKYFIQQFHFHSVSEHTIHSNHYPLEIHLVGKTESNQLGVLAILMKEGKNRLLLEKIGWSRDISSLPQPLCQDNKLLRPCQKSDDHNKYKIMGKIKTLIDFSYLNGLLSDKSFYHYKGSLTTPPCTENVDWFILKDIMEIETNQLNYYTQLLNNNPLLKDNHYHNNRHIQPLNGRNIEK